MYCRHRGAAVGGSEVVLVLVGQQHLQQTDFRRPCIIWILLLRYLARLSCVVRPGLAHTLFAVKICRRTRVNLLLLPGNFRSCINLLALQTCHFSFKHYNWIYLVKQRFNTFKVVWEKYIAGAVDVDSPEYFPISSYTHCISLLITGDKQCDYTYVCQLSDQ